MSGIRSARPSDLDDLYAISLATGAAGGDAAHLYEDGSLLGHIYSAPYLSLEPSLALVLEDDDGVAGFAVGAPDTVTWEQRLEQEWWPNLRRRYPDPLGLSAGWTPDQRRCAMIHHPEQTPGDVVGAYPAHMHLNLLPRAQGRGLGSRLLQTWLGLADEQGVQAVHVGVNRQNAPALRFWERRGFEPLESGGGAPRTAWMGRSPTD